CRRLQQRVPATLGGIGQRGGRGRRRLIEALAQARAHTAVGSAASRIMGERFVPALANRQAHAASVLASRESFSTSANASFMSHAPRLIRAALAALVTALYSATVTVAVIVFDFGMARMYRIARCL